MTNARGVLIIELVQGGFIVGAAGGEGVLTARSGRKDWSRRLRGLGQPGLADRRRVSEIVLSSALRRA
jgi:hypothetical protein